MFGLETKEIKTTEGGVFGLETNEIKIKGLRLVLVWVRLCGYKLYMSALSSSIFDAGRSTHTTLNPKPQTLTLNSKPTP